MKIELSMGSMAKSNITVPEAWLGKLIGVKVDCTLAIAHINTNSTRWMTALRMLKLVIALLNLLNAKKQKRE
jgi:hypothetical protein